MAIKAVAARPWGDAPRHASTWYEPYQSDEELERGVRFALSTTGVQAFCTPGDPDLMRRALSVAGNVRMMDPAEHEAAIEAVAREELIFPMPGCQRDVRRPPSRSLSPGSSVPSGLP